MRYRALGNTGLKISEVGFGCIPIIRLDTDEAIRVLRHAFEQGVNFFDTANLYRDSEAKIGKAFHSLRDKVVLATKTMCRDAKGAAEHLENSLVKLQTDYIDVYQLHQVAQAQDWEAITAPGGVLEVVAKAKDQGKIRFAGVTSHNLTMALKLMQTGIFATIMFPFNFIEDAAKDTMLRIANEQNIGFLAMKPFAGGVIDNAALVFKFLRQFPEVIAIPGFDSIESVNEILALYELPPILTTEDFALMDRYREELGRQFCRRCEYCQPCPQGVLITPAMGYPIIAKRMSPAVAVEFSGKVMASTAKCTACGTCVERCPYALPIPEILKKNYDLFEMHRQMGMV